MRFVVIFQTAENILVKYDILISMSSNKNHVSKSKYFGMCAMQSIGQTQVHLWNILWKQIMKAFGVHEMCDLEFKFITWWIKRYKVLFGLGIFLPLENLSLIWRRHQ